MHRKFNFSGTKLFKNKNVEDSAAIKSCLHFVSFCFALIIVFCFSAFRCSDAVYWSLWCGLICLMFYMMFVQNAKAPNKRLTRRNQRQDSMPTLAPTRPFRPKLPMRPGLFFRLLLLSLLGFCEAADSL